MIARPSPVPPYLPSVCTWVNLANSSLIFSGRIPMPVSRTCSRSVPALFSSCGWSYETVIVTPPSLVNLSPLDIRLTRICRSRVASERTFDGTSDA